MNPACWAKPNSRKVPLHPATHPRICRHAKAPIGVRKLVGNPGHRAHHSLAIGLIPVFLTGCADTVTRVAVTRRGPSAFSVEVTEKTRDPWHHLPATQIYRFTTPVAPIVTAAEIRDYETLYTGSDGTAHLYKAPVAGYILFSSISVPQRIEIHLVCGEECACHLRYPLSINGSHPINSR